MKNAENCIDASLLRKINKVSKDDKILTQDIKLGIKESIIKHLQFDLAREQMSATNKDWLIATCLMARDRIMVELDNTYPGYGFKDNKGYGSIYV